MKQNLLTGVASLLCFSLWAQPKVVSSTIEKVTVFYGGAQVTRTAKVSLLAGRTELVFKELSPQLVKESIQISMGNAVSVHSVVHQQSSQAETAKRDELASLTKQRQIISEKISSERANLKVYQREEEMLLKNQAIGGNMSGVKITDLKEALDFQRVRMQEVLGKQLEIEGSIKKNEEEIRQLNQQMMAASQTKDVSLSEILVSISTKEILKESEVVLTYFVQNAGWTPLYEARISSIEKPIDVLYKASVYQYTGENWKNVRLTLSNARPKQRGVAPNLQTWYWGADNNYNDYYNAISVEAQSRTQVSGFVHDAHTKMPILGASVTLKGTSLGALTDVNGFYRLNIPPDLQAKNVTIFYDAIGYVRAERSLNASTIDVDLKEDTKLSQEVVVTGYILSEKEEPVDIKALQGKVRGVSTLGANTISIKQSLVTESEAPVSQQFELVEPYTVLSDGKEYQAELKSLEMPALYEYYCVPKVDLDIFLTAKVLGWDRFNLLPGEISLFFEGTYLGKSSLDLSNQDTLSISLGRDKSILVKRTKLKEYVKKQFIGNNRVDTYSYEISVRNTRKVAALVVVEDQYPLSKYKQVEVFEQDAPDAELNKDTGKLTWRTKVDPSQEKKLRFRYTVKYPRSGVVELN